MSEANTAGAKAPANNVITELKVSGHLMTLETGLFCIVQIPSRVADPATGLPGVRISLPPGSASRPEVVNISTFRDDGWLIAGGDAALVRVLNGPAHVMVTVYQAPNSAAEHAPNLQVLRLLEPGPSAAARQAAPAPAPAAGAAGRAAKPSRVMEMVAHIQERGDVGAMVGEWLGEKGSRRWIEGFGLAPTKDIDPKDLEYQAVLGRGWLSPWVEGGQFCGSRGMALPLLGLRLRLRGPAADAFDVTYSATFIDGSEIGPVSNGEPCEAESLAAVESFHVMIRPRGAAAEPVAAPSAAAPAPAAKGGRGKAPAKAPAAEPVAAKPASAKPASAKPAGATRRR